MDYSLDDICATWELYPIYMFIPALVGPPRSCVFKFYNCHNAEYKEVLSTPFWDIYKVTSKGLKKETGFIFNAKGEIFRFTNKSISSIRKDNSYDFIKLAERTIPWSSNGIDLIRYENYGEVITDLCTVMGVDVTVDLNK